MPVGRLRRGAHSAGGGARRRGDYTWHVAVHGPDHLERKHGCPDDIVAFGAVSLRMVTGAKRSRVRQAAHCGHPGTRSPSSRHATAQAAIPRSHRRDGLDKTQMRWRPPATCCANYEERGAGIQPGRSLVTAPLGGVSISSGAVGIVVGLDSVASSCGQLGFQTRQAMPRSLLRRRQRIPSFTICYNPGHPFTGRPHLAFVPKPPAVLGCRLYVQSSRLGHAVARTGTLSRRLGTDSRYRFFDDITLKRIDIRVCPRRHCRAQPLGHVEAEDRTLHNRDGLLCSSRVGPVKVTTLDPQQPATRTASAVSTRRHALRYPSEAQRRTMEGFISAPFIPLSRRVLPDDSNVATRRVLSFVGSYPSRPPSTSAARGVRRADPGRRTLRGAAVGFHALFDRRPRASIARQRDSGPQLFGWTAPVPPWQNRSFDSYIPVPLCLRSAAGSGLALRT